MNHKEYKNLDYQLPKKNQFKIRVTTFIQGDLKNNFMDDCIKRGITEADMARDIIDTYYCVMKQQPFLVEKEIPEIKNWIIKNIKL